jgi:hypothetical protein
MTLRKAYIYFSFPALFLHELSHLFACVFTLTVPFGFRINLINGCVKYFTPKSAVVNAIINLAPFLNFLVAGFLVALNSYFLIYLVYLILTYRISLPSTIDYDNIRNYKKVVE